MKKNDFLSSEAWSKREKKSTMNAQKARKRKVKI